MKDISLPEGSLLKGGEYRILHKIGQGSFGIIYEAEQVRDGTKVSIKELFVNGVNGREGESAVCIGDDAIFETYRTYFRNEYSLLSGLKHPNIVSVLDCFDCNGTSYYVMELIEGTNLHTHIIFNRLSEYESLLFLADIADAVSYMHTRKVLHLDIKPLNIMCGDDGRLTLIDFGLSAYYSDTTMTSPIEFIRGGSVGYTPLEQSCDKCDTAAFPATMDVYALGATLYYCITGMTPPNAAAILNNGLPVDKLKKCGISDSTVSLIEKSMAPVVRDRTQTVDEFIDTIKTIIPFANKEVVYFENEDLIFEKENVPDAPVCDSFMGFSIHWASGVTYLQKVKIRNLLSRMHKVRTTSLFHSTEYGLEKYADIPVFALFDSFWENIWPLAPDHVNNNFYQIKTIQLAIDMINRLSVWTGLSFRMSTPNEISPFSDVNKVSRVLCYSPENGLIYRMIGQSDYLSPLNLSDYSNISNREFGIQLMCDGQKPEYDGGEFEVPHTQPEFDEILPIGFGFYKVRQRSRWNISTPDRPMASLLPDGYDEVSSINIYHIPGGKMAYNTFLGVIARKNDINSYFVLDNSEFKLKYILSDEQVKIREQWT